MRDISQCHASGERIRYEEAKTSLSFIITTLVVGLVTLFLLWSTFLLFSLYVGSMKQAAHTSSEQAVTQASNAISNYIGDMQEIMSLIEKDLTKSGGSTGQTLETLCSVRSDLVAVYIYDEQGEAGGFPCRELIL